jgi:hypothetical protein
LTRNRCETSRDPPGGELQTPSKELLSRDGSRNRRPNGEGNPAPHTRGVEPKQAHRARFGLAPGPLLGVLAVALCLLLAGIGWGLPRAVSPGTTAPWGYDEVAPLQPLTEAYYRFTRSGSEFLGYPLFHYMVLSVVYAPYMLLQVLSGRLDPSATFPYGMQDPVAMCQHLVILARLTNVCMTIGLILVVYDLTRKLLGRRAALWAAAMTAVLPTVVYYGKVSTVDIPYTLWVLGSCWSVQNIVRDPRRLLYYLLFGVFCSLAIGTKDQAVGYVILLPILLVAVRYRDAESGGFWARLRRAVAGREMILGLAAALVGFVVANNLLFGFSGYVKHIRAAIQMNVGNREVTSDLAGQIQLVRRCGELLLPVLGPAVALVLLGLVCCVRNRRWTTLGLILLPILGHHVVILARFGFVIPRFLIATSVFLIILGAAAVQDAPRGWFRNIVCGAAVVCWLYGLLCSVSLDYAVLHDARFAAEQWIRENAQEQARFEGYTSFQRSQPRVWDRYEYVQVGAEGMNEAELIRRSPDYVLISDQPDNPLRQHPTAGPFLENLEAGAYGYRVVADFDTPYPRIFPVRMILCLAPRVTILGRRE